MSERMVTTDDNPYNPFTHQDEWYAFDERKGYCTSSLLARTIITSDELPKPDQDAAYEEAVKIIITENITGRYIAVTRPTTDA